jgi:hypothetical protein
MAEFNPCPFCGGDDLKVTSKSDFYELQGQYGQASVRVTCWKCDMDMWEFSLNERDYAKRLELLAMKWNRRVSGERI